MKRSRILWVLWLLLAAVYCLIRNDSFGYLLLACSLVLPFLSGLLTGKSAKHLTAEVNVSAGGEKNAALDGTLLLKNKSLISAGRLVCTIRCENLLTGEIETSELPAAVPAKGQAQVGFSLKSRHAGRIRVTLEAVRSVDPFGLFSFAAPMAGEASAVTLVEPQSFGLEIQIAYGESANMDSDEYSMKKAGYDPSETFAIREYRPGDRIRQIHWKLTEKFDNLMVRDYGLPTQNHGRSCSYWKRDGCPEAVRPIRRSWTVWRRPSSPRHRRFRKTSLCTASAGRTMRSMSFPVYEIETEEDLRGVLPQLLGAAGGEDPFSAAEHYMETKEQLELAPCGLIHRYPPGEFKLSGRAVSV